MSEYIKFRVFFWMYESCFDGMVDYEEDVEAENEKQAKQFLKERHPRAKHIEPIKL